MTNLPHDSKNIPVDLFEQLVAKSGDGILFADREGIIRLWSHGCERMFGFSAAEAIGQSLDLIIPEPMRQRHWDGWRQVLRTGETRYADGLLKIPAHRAGGDRLSCEFTIVPVTGSDGEIFGFAAIMRDVTESWKQLKGLQERVRELEGKEG